jgi:hypothetical protein
VYIDVAGLSVTSVASPVETPERANIGTNKDTAVATNTGTARVGDGVVTATKSAGGAAATAATGNNAGGNRNGNANANAANGAASGNSRGNANGNGRAANNNNQRRGLKWAKRALSGGA